MNEYNWIEILGIVLFANGLVFLISAWLLVKVLEKHTTVLLRTIQNALVGHLIVTEEDVRKYQENVEAEVEDYRQTVVEAVRKRKQELAALKR